MSEADADVYRRWADGDQAAGRELVERHLPAIARYFANKVANRADAEELTSETFEQCARTLGRFRGESSFRGYLFGIAHNVLRDYLRRFGRAQLVELESATIEGLIPSASRQVAAKQQSRLLLAALRAVPLHTQIVLELSYFEELGRFEIAEILGVPPGTIASRLRRGRKQLESKLTELAESPEQLETTQRGIAGWIESMQRAIAAGD